jgi:hypothetical protein
MNPNLAIFLKRTVLFLLVSTLIVVAAYLVDRYSSIDLMAIGAYIMYGFFGLGMALMMVLIIGVTFKSVWVEIMRRSNAIVLCCADQGELGIHIVARHYHSGGDGGDGYDSFRHYYIKTDKGTAYMSTRTKGKDGSDVTGSLLELSKKTGRNLSFDKTKSVTVGSNTEEDKPVNAVLKLSSGMLLIKGYDGMMDYGFKLSFHANDIRKWSMRI